MKLDIEITQHLYNLSAFYAAKGQKYRSRALEKAAYTLDGFGTFIEELARDRLLDSLDGIGKSVVSTVHKILSTSESHDHGQGELGPDFFWAHIRRIPHCGDKFLQKIYESGITSFEELSTAVENSGLEIGSRAAEAILDYTRRTDPDSSDFVGLPFPFALDITRVIVDSIGNGKLVPCGLLRTGAYRIREISLITSSEEFSQVKEQLGNHRYALGTTDSTQDKRFSLLVFPGIRCTVTPVNPDLIQFNLLLRSSPDQHLKDLKVRASEVGLRMTARGIFQGKKNIARLLESEREVYECLELPLIPPELRTFPLADALLRHEDLLAPNSLKGEFHVHSTWSDGLDDVDVMADQARKLGYDYIAISDHSESLRVGNGLTIGQLQSQAEEIRQHNSRHKSVKVLTSSEVEILKDGELDYPQEVLGGLDLVVAAVHMQTSLSREEMTKRVLKAVENPMVNVLAHPMGGLTSRPGNFFATRDNWQLDFDKVVKACVKNHVALEINSFPERLDLSPQLIASARDQGAKFVVNSDAHSAYHMGLARFGVLCTRMAGCKHSDVLNTMSWPRIKKYLSSKPRPRIDLRSKSSPTRGTLLQRSIRSHSMKSLFNSLESESGFPKAVGIDLTGSPSRPSGWAVMDGRRAATRRLGSNRELIDATLESGAQIVSIDSPLALPFGRCCAKPECDCYSYGITRFCERFLMANRIGVYPSLIPSMVSLTLRGIELKDEFEKQGLKVIESFPGAAQDILGIPRKQQGLSKLEHGLRRFGIDMQCESSKISHDELDAVTSALVAYFFLSGDFLALGDDRENFLIVPSIQAYAVDKNGPVVIALAGHNGVGKTTVALHLAFRFGFRYIRYSQIIAKLASKERSYDKAFLQKEGLRLHRELGQERITMELIADMPTNQHVVIDGMRFPEDLATLKRHFGNRLSPIYLEAKRSKVFDRLVNSAFYSKAEKTEIEQILTHEVDNEVFQLSFLIYDKLENNGNFSQLFRSVDQMLRNL